MRIAAAVALLSTLAFADTSPRITIPQGVAVSWVFSRGALDERSGSKLELTKAKVVKGALVFEQGYAVSKDDKVAVMSGSFAIEIRAKFDEIARNWALLCMRGSNGRSIGDTWGFYCGAQGNLYFNANRNTVQTPGGAVTAGEWTHIIATVDKDTLTQKIFINGKEVATGPAAKEGLVDRGGPTYIGGCEQFGYHVFGSFSRVRLWKKSLTLADAEKLAREK